MEKATWGKRDAEIWLVEGREAYRWEEALVAWLHTFEAVLAKQSKGLGTLLLSRGILSGRCIISSTLLLLLLS